ncbi:hypothetical protein LIER_36752 [Lithospermum erythrorhizon]|uniref:Uncharacterized protein n=1 Tax=Lithospermum erythrorhizon TaxID=34254 RepID=A0AAV3PB45_LITER
MEGVRLEAGHYSLGIGRFWPLGFAELARFAAWKICCLVDIVADGGGGGLSGMFYAKFRRHGSRVLSDKIGGFSDGII